MTGPPPSFPHGPGNDDDDLRPSVIACAIVCLVISTLAVTARFYTRSVIVHAVAAEDWFALVALILSVGSTAGTIWQAQSGKGRHTWTLTFDDFTNSWKASWMTTLFYQLSLAACKISILLLYIRVLTYTYARRAAYALLGIVIIYNIFGLISTFTLCIPLARFWDRRIEGTCHEGLEYMWAVIGLHIGTDFLIFLTPMPVLIRMTMPATKKFMLVLAFAVGFFACLISVLRAVWIAPSFKSQDHFWDNVSITNWSSIEVCTAIVCTNLIVLRPLCSKVWQVIWPTRWRRSASGNEHNRPTSSSSSSSDERPPTIGTRPMGFSLFGSNNMGMTEGGGTGDGNNGDTSGGSSREKNGMRIEDATMADQYAAAVREVAMPSPGLPKTKEPGFY